MVWRAQVRLAVFALMLVLSFCHAALAHAEALDCRNPPPAVDSKSFSLKGAGKLDGVRLIRVLVEIDVCSRNNPSPEDATSMLTLSGGGNSVSVYLSLWAMEVSVGKDQAEAARNKDIQLLKRYIPLDTRYLLFSIYIAPRAGGSLSPAGRAIVKASEVIIRGTNFVVGPEIADPISPLSMEGVEALAGSDISITSDWNGGSLLLSADQSLIPFENMPKVEH